MATGVKAGGMGKARSFRVFMLAAACWVWAQWTVGQDGPNLIFILADDMGYADAGCFGQREIRTPSIDRLAAEGMRFTHFYAGAPVCAPSRSVLMTGLNTGHTRLRGNWSLVYPGTDGRVPLLDEDFTVAEVLKEAGYATAGIGKWGLGLDGSTGEPLLQGFDRWFGFLDQGRQKDYYTPWVWDDDHPYELPGNLSGEETYVHDLFTREALAFIRDSHPRPFFLYLAYTIPHKDFVVPELGQYADKPWTTEEKAYAAMVTRMDTDIGRLLALLDELGITAETLVIVTSDNGAVERWEGRFDSSGPLRGQKFGLYEGGIRAPLVARWPGRVEAGAVSDLVWGFHDILPTFAELAGQPVPADIDGTSMATVLEGGPVPSGDRHLYWEFHEDGFTQAVRHGSWKAVRYGLEGPLELYNLENDPGETRDVAANHPLVVADFETYLIGAREPSPWWPVAGE